MFIIGGTILVLVMSVMMMLMGTQFSGPAGIRICARKYTTPSLHGIIVNIVSWNQACVCSMPGNRYRDCHRRTRQAGLGLRFQWPVHALATCRQHRHLRFRVSSCMQGRTYIRRICGVGAMESRRLVYYPFPYGDPVDFTWAVCVDNCPNQVFCMCLAIGPFVLFENHRLTSPPASLPHPLYSHILLPSSSPLCLPARLNPLV